MLFTLLILTTAIIGAHSKALEPTNEGIDIPPLPKHQGKFNKNFNIENLVDSWNESSKQNVWELSGLHQGDIMLSDDEDEIDTQNGLIDKRYRWKDGVIPYYISPSDFDNNGIKSIKDAMDVYHRETCIRFRPYQSFDRDYIYISSKNTGCWSYVGRQDNGQLVNLQSPGCLGQGTIIHELLHAIGFHHQQCAPNRDDWVTIHWGNIQRGQEHNFDKYDTRTVTDFGYGYDYYSVMHYSAYAFSSNGWETIVPKVSGVKLGDRNGMSQTDKQKLAAMYNGVCH